LTDTPPSRTRALRLILALVGIGLVLVATLGWLNRRTLAREALTGWLKSRGIASEATVEAIGPTAFTARMRIGDPRRPDFLAERVEVRYRPRLSGIEVLSVTLRKPVLRASYRGGKLGMGALDPLVQEFLSRPPPPGAKLPRVQVDGGVLMLTSDYGPVRVTGDALIDDSQLKTLNAVVAPTRLSGSGFAVATGAATVRTATRSGRFELSLSAPFASGAFGGVAAQGGQLTLGAQLPYPSLQAPRADGPVTANLHIVSRRLVASGRELESADLTATFNGQTAGWIPDLAVTGRATATLGAGAGRFAGGAARAIRADLAAPDLRWTRKGGDRIAATVRLIGGAETATAGDLRLSALTLTAAGPMAADARGVTADLTASAMGRGGWTGLGAPTATDTAEVAAVRRAARAFRITAPAVSVKVSDGVTVGLPQPAVLVPDRGGAVRLSARGTSPVYGAGGGEFRLTASGGGLPGLDADVTRLTLIVGGAEIAGRLRAHASAGLVAGGDVDASGRLRIADGGLAFTADRCVMLKADRLEFGANDIEALSGRICAAGGPLFTARGANWTLKGRAEAVTAAAPFAEVQVDGGGVRLEASSRGGQLKARARVAGARLRDTAAATRFSPLILGGDVTFADYLWKADLSARRPGGQVIGRAELAHDTGLGIGLVVLDTGVLNLAEGGLQPLDLSPLAAAIGSPAVGSVRFRGRFDWAKQGASSSGTLSIPGLDFQSAAGPVKGLRGELAFTSLAPLVAAPGQELDIESIAGVVPLTALHARFELADNLLKIEGGQALVGGGRIRVEKLEYPLTPGAPTRGVLFVDGVQLHDLVEASPFGDKVDLDAKVSGRIAFESSDGKVRVSEGELIADQPGRISIDRTALTGVQADGAVTTTGGDPAVAAPANANDTFTDFAYQAMEHLAFDKLEATVASRADGRLGVLFHIVGRHDPPTKQRIRLTVMDLIQKRFLGRKLPLPSGTGVNLTLDTTLNLDDLLADYAEYRRLHGSAPVQP